METFTLPQGLCPLPPVLTTPFIKDLRVWVRRR